MYQNKSTASKNSDVIMIAIQLHYNPAVLQYDVSDD